MKYQYYVKIYQINPKDPIHAQFIRTNESDKSCIVLDNMTLRISRNKYSSFQQNYQFPGNTLKKSTKKAFEDAFRNILIKNDLYKIIF